MVHKILSAGCIITLFGLLQGSTVSAQPAALQSSHLFLTLTQPDTGSNSPLPSDELFQQQQIQQERQQEQWNQQNEQMRQQQSEQLRYQQDLQLEQNNQRQQQQIEQQQKLKLPDVRPN